MTDPRPPSDIDPGDNANAQAERGLTTGTSRWMRVMGIALAVGFITLLVVLHLTGAIGPRAH